ncbi:MAG TPA: copper resistance CopC family protein [Candidatus Limnocylindrales bacterium]|nr:copper resistance CopC family protein [Candidatus Limnocylindrales bacterium]
MHRTHPRATRRGSLARARAAIAALLLLLLTPAAVLADAELIASTPASGESLTAVPAEAILTFDEPLNDNSSFDIRDPSGATVATGALDAADPTVVRGPLPDLLPGTYQVQWVADSADGHLARGTFTFSVAAPTLPPATATPVGSDAPSAAASPTAEPTLAPSPSPGPNGSGDGSAGDALLPIAIVGLLIGGGLAVMLRRRSPA